MATKITVKNNGEPVQGAKVLVGELVGVVLTTNARGTVSFELSTGLEIYANVLIELPDGTPVTTVVHIVEGATHVVDVAILPPV